jgi:hypothetical protein
MPYSHLFLVGVISLVPEGSKTAMSAWKVKLWGGQKYFFVLEYGILSKPQKGSYLEMQNVAEADKVCLGNIFDKVFPRVVFDPNLTIA